MNTDVFLLCGEATWLLSVIEYIFTPHNSEFPKRADQDTLKMYDSMALENHCIIVVPSLILSS